MPSFKSRIVNFLLRNRHLFHGRLRKEVFDFNSSIEQFRKRCERGGRFFSSISKEITIEELTIDGVKAEWLIPKGGNETKAILYIHGGGYVAGSCLSHRGFVSKFAMDTRVRNLLYEYRLAPENPFPAALDDSIKVYQWMLSSGFNPKNILIAGDSAGGGLCLAMLVALRDKQMDLPVAAVAISPWTDLTCSSQSYATKNKISLAPLNSWTVFSKLYVGSNDITLPYISPLYGRLQGLPDIFINSGVNDELFEDGEKFYLKAKAEGVYITFRAGIGMPHCYPFFAPMFKEATDAMNEIVDFIKKQLNI